MMQPIKGNQLSLLKTETTEVRILSLWQPWASLIALGLKKYETRSWGTEYRGKLLIHSTKAQSVCVNAELERITQYVPTRADRHRLAKALPLPQGCVVAIADLANCQQMTNEWMEDVNSVDPSLIYADDSTIGDLEEACGNWAEGRYAWKLENIIALPNPIPWKGGQGLRYAPLELVELVNQQLKEVA